jgi:hypothetical protein
MNLTTAILAFFLSLLFPGACSQNKENLYWLQTMQSNIIWQVNAIQQ